MFGLAIHGGAGAVPRAEMSAERELEYRAGLGAALAAGYAVLELFFGVTGRQANVGHFAHLGGMLGGALMLLYWRLQPGRGGWRPT